MRPTSFRREVGRGMAAATPGTDHVLRSIGPDQWASYYRQIREVLDARPAQILEVGSGPGILRTCLRRHSTIELTSLDLGRRYRPDLVASVLRLPFRDGQFDLVCAFEVLEHLPFGEFERAVAQLVRVSRSRVVISLPHFGPSVLLDVKIPLLPRLRLATKIPYPRTHVFDGHHHWEIGKRGFPLSRIRAELGRHGRIERDYLPFDNRYHRFFVIAKPPA